MASTSQGRVSALPPIDARLATPETRYEVLDGKQVYVAPADPPHAVTQSALTVLLQAHRAEGFIVAVELLTRTSLIDDFAPDVSVYAGAPDPRPGRHQLAQLAFEIASTQALSNARDKAHRLAARGVRRVFALDLKRARVLEWAHAEGRWAPLDPAGHITDPALAVPLSVAALLDAAGADDAVARALRLKRHPEFLAERAEGRAEGHSEGHSEGRAEGRSEGLLIVLEARGLAPTAAERERIRAERDPARLERWLAAAATCADVASLLAH